MSERSERIVSAGVAVRSTDELVRTPTQEAVR
ncbi:MAG: hypothetical protein JWM12_1364 [Ilumatobacteraceae bacterium]|jgi:hypothetical protein|nr:hypothetical protein [Ilumatobacteraceae bacterium]